VCVSAVGLPVLGRNPDAKVPITSEMADFVRQPFDLQKGSSLQQVGKYGYRRSLCADVAIDWRARLVHVGLRSSPNSIAIRGLASRSTAFVHDGWHIHLSLVFCGVVESTYSLRHVCSGFGLVPLTCVVLAPDWYRLRQHRCRPGVSAPL